MRSRHGRGGFARLRWLWAKSPSYFKQARLPMRATRQVERAHHPPWRRSAPPCARPAEPSRLVRRRRRRTPPSTASTRWLPEAPRREATIWPPWGDSSGLLLVLSPDAAAGGRRRRWGQNGKCRGEQEERLMFAWLWRDVIFLIQVGLRRILRHYEVAT
jgi:hypothetical protein